MIRLQLKERGVNDFELFYKNYLVHNEKLWERYRNGYIKQEELRVKRMWLALLDFKIADETLAQEMNVRFLRPAAHPNNLISLYQRNTCNT